jgi:recombination protein RecT
MSSDLAIFESTLRPLTPHFEQVLGRAMPVERLMRTIMISIERNPKLLLANRQSLLNSAMSAACLGLEVDGITGQAFFIPFKGAAQLVIGYKGMNTLAARSGYTVQGEVVRADDAFDYELGDKGYVKHKPLLGSSAPIVAAWATASSLRLPSIVSVLGISDIMDIKKRSPGAARSESPWNDMVIGFAAMASKSAKRRLSRAMPLNVDQRFHQAATMEEAHEERGKLSWIDPNRGVQIEGEFHDGPQINHDQRSTVELLAPREDFKSTDVIPTAADYHEQWRKHILNATRAESLGTRWQSEKTLRSQIEWTDEHPLKPLIGRVTAAIEELKASA